MLSPLESALLFVCVERATDVIDSGTAPFYSSAVPVSSAVGPALPPEGTVHSRGRNSGACWNGSGRPDCMPSWADKKAPRQNACAAS